MFKTGRLMFGLVLMFGGVQLFVRAWTGPAHGLHAAELLGTTWLAALGLGLVAAVAARWWRRPIGLATSLAVPWIGLALVLPLSIHYVAGAATSGWSVDGFDEWASMSLHWMLPAHVTLAILMSLRMRELAAGTVPHPHRGVLSLSAIYGVVCGVAAIPLLVPAYYVALTGIPVIPLMRATDWIAAREHAGAALPEAHVIAA